MKNFLQGLWILVFSLMLCASYSEAVVFFEEIPAYPGSEILKEDVNAKKVNDTYCTKESFCSSESSVRRIVDFYKKELPSKGWKLTNQEDDREAKTTKLFFSRAKHYFLVVTVYSEEDLSLIYVRQLQGDVEEVKPQPCTALEDSGQGSKGVMASEDNQGRDLDSVPRYPGSIRDMFVEELGAKEKITLTYKVIADIEDVADFYRQNMLRYNWQLASEHNLGEEIQNYDLKNTGNFENINLVFKGASGNCVISIMSIPNKSENGVLVIHVDYSEA